MSEVKETAPPSAPFSGATEPNTPARARTRKRPGWKRRFIEVLSHTANVTTAARAAGVNRSFAYEARHKDAALAKEWDEAVESAIDEAEQELWRRGVQGVREPVFQKGERVGHIRRYSDTALLAILKAKRPALYRERVQVEQTGHSEAMSNLDAEILKSLKEVALADPKLREVFAQQLLANPEFVAQLAGVVPQGQAGVPSPTESP